jgi:hypothetical protein
VITLIGWDAAVDPRNNALVRADFQGNASGEMILAVDELVQPESSQELVATIASWIDGAHEGDGIVICADSPLGWPAALGGALTSHRAGEGIPLDAEALFRRHTDRDVRQRVGKTPLDVGADRIARTALAVVNAVAGVADRVAEDRRPTIAVSAGTLRAAARGRGVALLETYPAGWFSSEGIATRGYRPAGAVNRRRSLLDEAREAFRRSGVAVRSSIADLSLARRADDLDALICVFAGVDAIRGMAPEPPASICDDVSVEGWIWCKDRI